MSDLLAEVDDMMRRERVEKFFHEHGKMVLTFVAATILATAAVSFYQHWNHSQQEKSTSALMALLDDPAFPENIQGADLKMRGNQRGIALLNGAAAFLDLDKPDQALSLYRQAAEDGGIAPDFRQLAQIMAVRLDDTLDGATALKALQPIWNDRGSPWRSVARIDGASIMAGKNGNFAGAVEQLSLVLEAEDLPESLRNKAVALNHIYTLELQKQDQANAKDKSGQDS